MPILPRLKDRFEAYFHSAPSFFVRAPGRVNLMGEHTDYNDGFVLPMAIDRAIRIALRARADRRVRLISLDFEDEISFAIDGIQKESGWGEYIKGIARELQRAGVALNGWEGVMTGDVPRGAGLSSSAAVEMAAARAFAAVSGFAWDARRMAQIGQRTENEWIGVNCGIMDQTVSAAARAGHALFLDTRSLDYQHVPVPENVAIAVMDTATRRALTDTAYNERRAQCEQVAHMMGVAKLRDVTLGDLQAKKNILTDILFRRARHVLTENRRVLEAVTALQAGDLDTLGRIFNESHRSLQEDFEVTNEALDQIVAIAQAQQACYGARMTGAGFGGAAVALVKREAVEVFTQAVETAYRLKSGREAQIYICRASAGASILSFV